MNHRAARLRKIAKYLYQEGCYAEAREAHRLYKNASDYEEGPMGEEEESLRRDFNRMLKRVLPVLAGSRYEDFFKSLPTEDLDGENNTKLDFLQFATTSADYRGMGSEVELDDIRLAANLIEAPKAGWKTQPPKFHL